MRSLRFVCSTALIVTALAASSCRRTPSVSDAAYRDAVAAFHTSLAALQTSQDVLARRELERVVQLVPHEPAGWANLGLLLLRQQQLDEALQRLAKASELAPRHAPVERLLALAHSQKGDVGESIRHWRRAMELDGVDLRAPFSLAQEVERQGGAENEAEAQRVLASLADRSGNLAAQLEYARLSARRGDAPALQKALGTLTERAAAWSSDAQARLQTARDAAGRSATSAATPLIFLKNVLIRAPEYRAAYAAVTTPRSEIGEPLVAFVILQNPLPQPAPADEQLAFAVDAEPVLPADGATWGGALWLNGEGPPVIVAAGGREVRLATGVTLPFPGGRGPTGPGMFGILGADLNYDFRTDLILAGAGGLRMFRQGDRGGFTDVTAAAKLPASITAGAVHGAWAADVDTEGDLDVLIAGEDGPLVLLRNNGDGTFLTQSPFSGVTRVRGFVWADLDGEGVPDAALLDAQGVVHTFLNLRGGEFRERAVPAAFTGLAAIAAAELTGDAVLDLAGVTTGGVVMRLSHPGDGAPAWEAAEVARVDVPTGLSAGTGRLIVADVDNNASVDLIVSSQSASRVLLRAPGGRFRPLPAVVPIGVSAAADLDGNGRLELIGRSSNGAGVALSLIHI